MSSACGHCDLYGRDECPECGELVCENCGLCACDRQAAEAEAAEQDRALWMSGALEWHDRANAPGFSVTRLLRQWYRGSDRVHRLAVSASPMLLATYRSAFPAL